MRTSFLTAGACLMALVLASGCGSVSNARKIDYRNTKTLPSLEIPPDLSTLPESNLPAAGSATYSGYAGEQRTTLNAVAAVLPRNPNVRLARDGQTRYVVIKAEPAAVWDEVREFLTATGLSIASENPKAGLLETGWARNRALVGAPEGNFLTRWLGSYYSTSFRDKYRVRLEHGLEPGTTEIYISHQGMEEIVADQIGASRASGWQSRPSDPSLEAEMLHRLVAHLIGDRPTATQVAKPGAASTPQPAPVNARLTRNGNGAPRLTLEDSLDRAWRRVGLSLDRIGFTVEDRDRSKGIYYVRYIDPETKPDEKGFFSRLFGGDEPGPPNQYQVHIKPAEGGTNVEVLNQEGTPATSKTGERILSLLFEQLK